jgi:hypothetical protein
VKLKKVVEDVSVVVVKKRLSEFCCASYKYFAINLWLTPVGEMYSTSAKATAVIVAKAKITRNTDINFFIIRYSF